MKRPPSQGAVLLSLADAENLSAARWAYAMVGRPAVLQRDSLGVLDLFLGPALKAITFHVNNLHFRYDYIHH